MVTKTFTKKEKRFTKKVYKGGDISKKQYKVLKELLTTKSPSLIALKLNYTRQNINNYFNRLQKNGLIDSNYNLTQKALVGVAKRLQKNPQKSLQKEGIEDLRGHSLGVMFKILGRKPSNWEKRRNEVTFKNLYDPKLIELRNNVLTQGRLEDKYYIRTTPKHIIAYLPEILSANIDKQIKEIFNLVFYIAPRLERMYGVILTKEGYHNIRIISQHYAIIKNSLAKKFNEDNNKFYVKVKGELRLIIDNSLNLNEFEAVNYKWATEDIDLIKSHFYDLITSNCYRPRIIKQKIDKLDSDQKNTYKNINKLVKTLQNNPPATEIMYIIKALAIKIDEQSKVNKDTNAGLNTITTYLASQLPKNNIKPYSKDKKADYIG